MTPLYKGITFHRSALIGIALLATGLFAATVHADDYTKTFTISNRANVRVDTGDGSVVVTTSDSKEVEFRVEYQGYVLEKSLQSGTMYAVLVLHMIQRLLGFESCRNQSQMPMRR